MEHFYCQILTVITLILAGVVNSLSNMWTSKMYALGTERFHRFDHTFIKVLIMFVAELSCLVIFVIKRSYERFVKCDGKESVKFNVFLFLPPSLLGIASNISIFAAMKLTYSFDISMLECIVLMFTCLLSVAFIRSELRLNNWVGIIVIAVDGLFVVGLADCLTDLHNKVAVNGIVAGNLLSVIGQIVRSIQVVYEEIIIKKYDVAPTKAVGLEGLFGSVVIGICLVPLFYTNGGSWFCNNPQQRVEDPLDAFTQIFNDSSLLLGVIIYFVSMLLLRWSCISIIKEFNAITSMVFHNIRTIPVGIICFIIGWQPFTFLYIIGFILLSFGVCIYFNITILPLCNKYILNRREPQKHLHLKYSTATLLS